jgi:SAM-dependent methyltransferase
VTARQPSAVSAAQEKWDNEDLARVRQVAWSGLSTVNDAIWRAFSPHETPAQLVARKLKALGRDEELAGLAVVCGDMQGERVWFENLPGVSFRSVDGYDISAASMARYSPPPGLTWRPHQDNCNRLQLPEAAFDLAVAWHGAHHVENLGGLFYEIHQSLRAGGLLFMYEWIGPEYLQIPRVNAAVAHAMLFSMFSRRERTSHMGLDKGVRRLQPSPSQFDPSEACNSTDLMRQYLRYFTPAAQVLHAGLLYPVFEGIAQNLDETDIRTLNRICRVISTEKWLARLGLIEPLFVVSLGQRREGVVGSVRPC